LVKCLTRSDGRGRFAPVAARNRKNKLGVLLLLLAVHAQAAQNATHITIAGRDVAIWRPAGTAPEAGYPLILFSHGFGGCNTQSVFLMEAFAQAGYLVLAPNHKDAGCGKDGADSKGWYPGKFAGHRPEEPFGQDSKWSDATYKDRAADMEAVLNAVLGEKSFQEIAVDPERIGVAGHSLGGYTVLGLAGAWPSWKDHRIRAVLALSPYCTPYISKGDLRHLDVPIMYQGGNRDLGISPTVRRSDGAYDRSSAPKYYVEFDGAGHFAWTNLQKKYQDLIDTYSVAFFDRYLKDKANPDRLSRLTGRPSPQGVSYLKAQAK